MQRAPLWAKAIKHVHQFARNQGGQNKGTNKRATTESNPNPTQPKHPQQPTRQAKQGKPQKKGGANDRQGDLNPSTARACTLALSDTRHSDTCTGETGSAGEFSARIPKPVTTHARAFPHVHSFSLTLVTLTRCLSHSQALSRTSARARAARTCTHTHTHTHIVNTDTNNRAHSHIANEQPQKAQRRASEWVSKSSKTRSVFMLGAG